MCTILGRRHARYDMALLSVRLTVPVILSLGEDGSSSPKKAGRRYTRSGSTPALYTPDYIHRFTTPSLLLGL